jgi:transcriptional regulator of acetoin/glycerol metabolism
MQPLPPRFMLVPLLPTSAGCLAPQGGSTPKRRGLQPVVAASSASTLYGHAVGQRQKVLDELRQLAQARQKADQRESEPIAQGRQAGLTWQEMAVALGVDRSTIWRKYSDHS